MYQTSHVLNLHNVICQLYLNKARKKHLNIKTKLIIKSDLATVKFFCFFFLLFRAALAAYGDSQARGRIGAVAVSLCQNHSNAGSKPHLQPTSQLTAMPDP